jgi:hypothetical protein
MAMIPVPRTSVPRASTLAVCCALWAASALGCGDDAGPKTGVDASLPVNGVDAAVPDSAAPLDAGSAGDAGLATRLSQTGLYRDMATQVVASDVRAFVPQGVLWSDGADKQRWVYLPPGTQIDSSKMDDWILPVGTKLWKEFALDGKRLETRLLEKVSKDKWTMVAYGWLADQSDAIALPDGQDNVAGTAHDIPSRKQCASCHDGVADSAIGFGAILLAHKDAKLTLDQLVSEHRLSKDPTLPIVVPGTAAEQRALLYLHANCGNCHNERTFISNVTDVNYKLRYDQLGTPMATNSYRSITRDLRRFGSAEGSYVIRRMAFRGAQGQMPPLASELVDEEGLATVRVLVHEWATQLGLPILADAGVETNDGGSLTSLDGGALDAGSH